MLTSTFKKLAYANRFPPLKFLTMATIYTAQQQRTLLIISLLVLGGFIITGLSGYATSFLGAGILYVVFRPWFHALVVKRGWNRNAVTIGIIVFALLAIVLPFLALSLMLIDRIQYYSQNSGQIMELVNKVETLTDFKLTDQKNLQTLISRGASFASSVLPSVAGGALDFLVVIGMMFFALYYMFVEENVFLKGLERYLPFRKSVLKELGEALKNNVNANVTGQLIICMIQGALTGLMLWVFGIPDAVFWGVVCFFMSFIPVLGTPIVWVPAALIQISQGNTGQGIGILVVGAVVITNIDNVLRITFAKKMGDIHPLITFAGILLGIPIFGLVGLVIGPLLVSYFIVLIKVFEQQNRPLAARETEVKNRLAESLPETRSEGVPE